MKRAGLLNEVIKIYSPSSQVNEYGEKVQTYTLTYTTRARVEHTSGNRSNENNEIFYSYQKTFTVRSYVPVTEYDQVEYNNKRYRIITIDDRIKVRNDKLIITELIND
jgi:SPP1 family predicted phage head-tail adaptor